MRSRRGLESGSPDDEQEGLDEMIQPGGYRCCAAAKESNVVRSASPLQENPVVGSEGSRFSSGRRWQVGSARSSRSRPSRGSVSPCGCCFVPAGGGCPRSRCSRPPAPPPRRSCALLQGNWADTANRRKHLSSGSLRRHQSPWRLFRGRQPTCELLSNSAGQTPGSRLSCLMWPA